MQVIEKFQSAGPGDCTPTWHAFSNQTFRRGSREQDLELHSETLDAFAEQSPPIDTLDITETYAKDKWNWTTYLDDLYVIHLHALIPQLETLNFPNSVVRSGQLGMAREGTILGQLQGPFDTIGCEIVDRYRRHWRDTIACPWFDLVGSELWLLDALGK